MASQKQINANGQNAQNSTGPRTTEGKAAASQNAVKHGLSAKYDCISSESQADFDLHRQRLLDELSPSGHIESMLAERVVSLSWRLERTVRIQNQVFDAMIFDSNNPSPLVKLTQSMLPKHLKDSQPKSPPELELGQLAIKDFSNYRVLDRLLMYERRIENSLYKTTLELQRLRLERNLDTISPTNNEPRTINNEPRTMDYELKMQNEPNFKNDQINTNTFRRTTYDKLPITCRHKNEPNSNPISTSCIRTRPAVMSEKTKAPSNPTCTPA